MENAWIIVILAVVMVSATLSSLRHFKGEGCCGGGGYRPRRKRLSGVKYTKVFRIGGMHCEHCKRRVEEAVNDIKGVAGRVNLKRGELTVSYAEDVPDETVRERIERVGYTVGQ